MLRVNPDPSFDQDVDRLKEMGYQIDDLKYVIGVLAKEKKLNPKYMDHPLRSKYANMQECHIEVFEAYDTSLQFFQGPFLYDFDMRF